MPDLLIIESLRAGYGEAVVLPNMSLAMPEGQVLAVLGRNGTGKTTLLNALLANSDTTPETELRKVSGYDGPLKIGRAHV